MSEWINNKLGKVCEIKIGGTPSRSNKQFWDTEYSTENHWVSIKDMNKIIISETSERITDLGIKKSNAKLISIGTILLSFKLTVGKVAFAGVDLYTNEAIAAIKSNEIDNLYLFYGLQYWNLLKDVDNAIKGITLNKKKINDIHIFFPKDLNEQTRIAEILSICDKVLEQTKAIINKQQRIKTGLIQDLLTKGIDENGNIRSEVTHEFIQSNFKNYQIPKSWMSCNMRDICYVRQGLQIAIRNRFKEEGKDRYTYITIQYLNNPEKYIEFIANPPKNVICNKNDIIFTRTGNTGQIVSNIHGVFHNNFFKIFYDGNNIIKEYLIYFLKWSEIQSLILDLAGTTTIPDLNHNDFYSIPIIFPKDITEQNKIVHFLIKIDKEIEYNQIYLNKLKSIKTGLMKDLLSGKVRVNL